MPISGTARRTFPKARTIASGLPRSAPGSALASAPRAPLPAAPPALTGRPGPSQSWPARPRTAASPRSCWRRLARGGSSSAWLAQPRARLRAARERLAEHLQPPGESGALSARAVYEKYPRLFRSRRIEAVAEVLIHLHRFGLMRCVEGELGVEQIELFLAHYSPEEVLRRFEKVHEWMGRYHKTNHDGTILTPALVEYLAQNEEIEVLLEALDRRRTDTRKGRFRCADRP